MKRVEQIKNQELRELVKDTLCDLVDFTILNNKQTMGSEVDEAKSKYLSSENKLVEFLNKLHPKKNQ